MKKTLKPVLIIAALILSIVVIGKVLPKTGASKKQVVDLLISNGVVITMDQGKIIEEGSIAVAGGKIIEVGTSADLAAKYTGAEVINAAGKLIIPGLVNTHGHVPMTLLRGISDDRDLMDWLNNVIVPKETEFVSDAFVRAGTRLGIAEMIKGGTTTYCDMYYFEDAIADETSKAGMRGVLGETIIKFAVNDNKTPEEALVYCERYINKWKDHPLVTPAIAPHAPYTVPEEILKKVTALSAKLNAPVIIHLSETAGEVKAIKDAQSMEPIAYFEKIGFLNNRVTAAHVVSVSPAEIDILVKHGVGVAHNPQSNMKLASGVSPVTLMLKKKVALGLGTDGPASNNDLSMWEEMDIAAKLQKVHLMDPKVLSAEEAFAMGTIGGARALHMDEKIGSLRKGKLADIAIVDCDNLNQVPYYNYYSLLVYSTKASDVSTVIINGKVVMKDRKLLTLDEAEVKRTANVYRERIKKSLAGK